VSFVRFAAHRATVIFVQFHVVARRLNRGVTRLISAAVMSAAREHINNTAAAAAAAAKCFQETAMPSRLVPPPAAVLLLLRRGPRHLRGHDFGRGRIKRSISPPAAAAAWAAPLWNISRSGWAAAEGCVAVYPVEVIRS